MFADNRHNIIYDMIKTNGAVTTSELMEFFNVSIETIRRDLLSMEKKNLLKRVHGGAVSIGEMKAFHRLDERNEENYALKQELSENAAGLVSDGDIIAIDSGSTAIAFAEALKKHFSRLTVITHSLDVFDTLCRYKDFCVILCSGYFKKDENAFYGRQVIDSLDKLHVDKSFICPTAISIKHGICDFDCDFIDVQRKLTETGNNIYILADSSKFEKTALLKMDEAKREYIYVTDSKMPDALIKLYKENEFIIYRSNEVK